MRKVISIISSVFTLSSFSITAQPNCNIYKENQACYEACLEAEKGLAHPQGSKASQKHFLNSVQLCPEFAFSYYERSVPYAKRGLMNEWITIFNQAVALDPSAHLGWRGWYHFFFMHNYPKAISDIDSLDALVNHDIGETGDGLYHLNIMKALCYKGLNEYQIALEIFTKQVESEDYYVGSYDHLHLGVIYLQLNKPSLALKQFEEQNDFNEISEAYFYSAIAYEMMGDVNKAVEQLETSLNKYASNIAMHNPYRQLPDEIYEFDIERKLKTMISNQ